MIPILWSCRSDVNNPLGLEEKQLTYAIHTGTERLYPGTATLIDDNKKYKLNIRGHLGSDGIIIKVENIKKLQPQVLRFGRKANVILNEKKEHSMNIYVSSGCKNNSGTLEVLEWDTENQTITGIFSGPLCTRGIFAHLPGTEIKEGAFYKLKYNVV